MHGENTNRAFGGTFQQPRAILRTAAQEFLERLRLLGKCVSWGTRWKAEELISRRTRLYGGERRDVGNLADQYCLVGNARLFRNGDRKLGSGRLLGNGELSQP